MIRIRFSLSSLAVVACLAIASVIFSSCWEGGVGDLAGGGTGGTGISTGPITGFGSVVMEDEIFKTDEEVAPGFKTKKTVKGVEHSDARDRDLFRVGMIVTILHGNSNNASEIDFDPVLRGPVAAKIPGVDPAIVILGQTVVVGNPALFASLEIGHVVDVSGFVDSEGRFRATYLETAAPAPVPGEEFEIKGYISAPDPSAGTFVLGPLPDGTAAAVTVSYSPDAVPALPAGPSAGSYVRIATADEQPVNGVLTAVRITPSAPRTAFPENATASLDGLVTKVGTASGSALSFDLEGKEVHASGQTEFLGGTASDIRRNARILAQGREIGGILAADRIVFR